MKTTKEERDAVRAVLKSPKALVHYMKSNPMDKTATFMVRCIDDADELERLREHEAEAAMHCLCHVDADMSERVEVARALALAIGHPWPPYEDEEDEDEENACCVLALLEPTP